MNDKERFNMMRVEIERLRKLREDVRKKEVKYKEMDKKAKDLKGYKESNSFCNYMHHPEYKLNQIYHELGWEITSKIDSMLTFIEEHDTK